MERMVKGTALKDLVIGIRSDKPHESIYEQMLSSAAKEYLNERIMNSVWYSYENYIELYAALIKVFAKDNPEYVIKWGREFGEKVMGTVYKNLIVEGNVKRLLEMYPRFHKILFNFGTLSLEWISENEVLFTYKNFESKFDKIYYSNVGWTERAIEMCIRKKVEYQFLKKSWEGDDVTQFKLFWAP
ncbi:MAG: hypothetical protein JW891_04645 [Candidatus Lokiarchaeota archaeon]|nr:hypothetical protein [Candidatus Lokiarchaeota archaeon]